MSRLCLLLCRFCFSAWVGAAALFVVIGVRQVTSGVFDATVRGQLALLRFPLYYLFGFTLVGLGWLCLLGSRGAGELSRRRWWIATALTTAALVIMGTDYLRVYLPMEQMLTPPDAPRPAEFMELHRISEVINTVHVSLVLAAAVLLNWPGKSTT